MKNEEFKTCFCGRCGEELRVDAASRDPEAEMLRKSANPAGVCLECAVTEWFANSYPINMQLDRSPQGPQTLLIKPLQERFGAVMKAAHANAELDEINWEKVVLNWELPCQVELGATNCYMPRNGVLRETKKAKSKRR